MKSSLATAVLLLAVASRILAAPVEVVVRADAKPGGTIVRLADVAEVVCDDPALSNRLGELPLMPNPAAGALQHVRSEAIRDLLRAQGEDLTEVRFTGAPVVRVGRDRYARAGARLGYREGLTSPRSSDAPAVRRVAPTASAKSVAKPPAEPEALTPVVVAIEAIQQGELITSARVRTTDLTAKQLARVPSPVADPELVIGKEASRAIRAGEPVTDRNCSPPLLVRRGEAVTVFSGGGGISVRMLATARADGRAGDLIPVELDDRRERVDARVVGVRRVAILGGAALDARFASSAAGAPQ